MLKFNCSISDAGMEVSVLIRSCGILKNGDTPKCTAILDLVEAEQKADILSQLSQLSSQYKTVTYNGHHCQSADGSVWPLVNNTLDSGKHTFDKGNSGNSLGLARNLMVLCLVMLRFYE